ncbi:hypothetical protein B0H14DRAFT_2557214 [Mycena olivaceomarginata]|nr:hypothetical protein B0H14DRAFT_2557214 [Mycena olivaceomarginata]
MTNGGALQAASRGRKSHSGGGGEVGEAGGNGLPGSNQAAASPSQSSARTPTVRTRAGARGWHTAAIYVEACEAPGLYAVHAGSHNRVFNDRVRAVEVLQETLGGELVFVGNKRRLWEFLDKDILHNTCGSQSTTKKSSGSSVPNPKAVSKPRQWGRYWTASSKVGAHFHPGWGHGNRDKNEPAGRYKVVEFQEVINKAFEDRTKLIAKIAKDFEKPEHIICTILSSACPLKMTCRPSLRCAVIHDRHKSYQDDGISRSMDEIRQELKDDIEDGSFSLKDLEPLEETHLLNQLLQHRGAKNRGIRATSKAAQLDRRLTAASLQSRQLRAHAQVRAVVAPMSETTWPAPAARCLTWYITNKLTVKMEYMKYDFAIREMYGVQIVGLPSDIELVRASLWNLETVRRVCAGLKEGSVCWVKMTKTEHEALIAKHNALCAESASGSLRQRATRSDKGTRRKKTAEKEGIGTVYAAGSDTLLLTTAMPVNPTPAPVNPTPAPINPTTAPVNQTAVSVNPTPAPVNLIAAPVNPTAVSVNPTPAPVNLTPAPVNPTPAPPSTQVWPSTCNWTLPSSRSSSECPDPPAPITDHLPILPRPELSPPASPMPTPSVSLESVLNSLEGLGTAPSSEPSGSLRRNRDDNNGSGSGAPPAKKTLNMIFVLCLLSGSLNQIPM